MRENVEAFFEGYDFVGEAEEIGLAFQHYEDQGEVLFMIEQEDDLDRAAPHAERAMAALKAAHPGCAHLKHRVEADH